jgi:hypothetical protein
VTVEKKKKKKSWVKGIKNYAGNIIKDIKYKFKKSKRLKCKCDSKLP